MFFLHTSQSRIDVGEKITYDQHRVGRGMASDSLPNRTYAWDLLDSRSTELAWDTVRNADSPDGESGRYIYITKARAENVRPDLNVGSSSDRLFTPSASRAIVGEQEILGRLAINPGTSFEDAHAMVIQGLKQLNIPFYPRGKEESDLANLAVLLDSRAQQEAEEYVPLHLSQNAELRYKQFLEGSPMYEPGGRFEEIGELGRTQGKQAFIDAATLLAEERAAENGFPFGVRTGVVGRVSSDDVKLLRGEVDAFLEMTPKGLGSIAGMAEETLQGVIAAGEIAAKIMRWTRF